MTVDTILKNLGEWDGTHPTPPHPIPSDATHQSRSSITIIPPSPPTDPPGAASTNHVHIDGPINLDQIHKPKFTSTSKSTPPPTYTPTYTPTSKHAESIDRSYRIYTLASDRKRLKTKYKNTHPRNHASREESHSPASNRFGIPSRPSPVARRTPAQQSLSPAGRGVEMSLTLSRSAFSRSTLSHPTSECGPPTFCVLPFAFCSIPFPCTQLETNISSTHDSRVGVFVSFARWRM
jgi:hypothetical protein